MQQNVKSATTAGLLGIFLGAFGAHNWYLGDKKKGIIHVAMMSGGVILEIIAGAILPNVMSYSMLFTMAWLLTILGTIASIAMGASAIWGLVEGITILTQGDAGLARRGYVVADPNAAAFGQPAPQPGYGPQPYAQPGYAPQYGQPQGYYGQPMQPMPQNQPMQPMQPTMPTQPVQPMQPVNPVDPSQPTNSNEGAFNGQQ